MSKRIVVSAFWKYYTRYIYCTLYTVHGILYTEGACKHEYVAVVHSLKMPENTK